MVIVILLAVLAAVVLVLSVTAGFVVAHRRERTVELEPPPAAEAPPEAPPLEAPPVEEAAVVAPVRPTFRDRLTKARGALSGYVNAIRSRKVDDETWNELEEALILADVGVTSTDRILGELREVAHTEGIADPDVLLDRLKAQLKDALAAGDRSLRLVGTAAAADGDADRTGGDAGAPITGDGAGTAAGDGAGTAGGDGDAATAATAVGGGGGDGEQFCPDVWLFVGVNGVGKTTTIGKIAHQQRAEGRSVVMAAGDTFRAAASEQLATWAERTDAEIVRGAEGGDPSSVVYDAVQRAAARRRPLVLADTAGRLHTKTNLMEELRKVRRVAGRDPGRVSEVLLVLDATTGQNGLAQAQQFAEAVELTGVVLTKLDGSAKGGIALAIQTTLGIPIKLVGLGESVEDLVEFDPDAFVEALFA